MTGAMFIAECLKQEGVTKVFGQCGHTNYALIDACHRLGIEYVSFRHEQQAAHAADAYYRLSHKLAVVNVHLSPGLTNALTGVATAAAIVIFWPAAFFVGGDKQTAAELAQMKGQMVAIEQESNMKRCGIQFQGPRPPGT